MTSAESLVKPAGAGRRRWAGTLGVAVLVVGAGLAAYQNSFRGPFVLDDPLSIAGNPTLRHLAAAWHPPKGAGLTVEGRPLLNVSFAANYALGGTAVEGYHAVNLAIHLLAGLTLFGIVRRTLTSRESLVADVTRRNAGAFRYQAAPPVAERAGVSWDDATLVACFVALLWTLHPLQTESVTYVVQRAESLMGLFYLLTLYCFIRACPSSLAERELRRGEFSSGASRGGKFGEFGNGSFLWFGLSCLACLCGMMAKEVMVTAPILVAFYDRTFVAGSWGEVWRRRRFYYLCLAATWMVLAVLVAGAGDRGGTIGPSAGISAWGYALCQSRAVIHYLRLSVWPNPLIVDYGEDRVGSIGEVWTFLLADAALLGLAAWAWRRRPALGFVGGCFFLLLAPTSSVVGGTRQMLAEHRMYLPLAAVIILAVAALWAWLGRRAVIVLAALAVACGAGTLRRNADYRDSLTLYGETVSHRPQNAFAQSNDGFALELAGRMSEAADRFEAALRLRPDYAIAHFNLGVVQSQLGRIPEAVAQYQSALRLIPGYAEAHNNLGVLYGQTGRAAEAEAEFAAAVRCRPDFAEARANLELARRQMEGAVPPPGK